MAGKVVKLNDVASEQIPHELRAEAYFDFKAHPFAHQALFEGEGVRSVCHAIQAIGGYAKGWLTEAIGRKRAENAGLTVLTDAAGGNIAQAVGRFEVVLEEGAVFAPALIVGSTKAAGGTAYVAAGASVVGSIIYLAGGDIYIGAGTTVEPAAGIKGPTIIGEGCEIRQGAYLRGNCILGDGCIIRGELKNVVMMDGANFPHPSYVGDSLCGYRTHFGNQVTTANLGIYEGIRDADKRRPLVLRIAQTGYDLGSPKMGIVMGDFSQIGCNSITDPGTFLGPYTIAYALTRLNKGFYGPHEVLKNKPMEHGIIERVPLKPYD